MSITKEFSNVLIIGLGLIGGSIAKKLKNNSFSGKFMALIMIQKSCPSQKRII